MNLLNQDDKGDRQLLTGDCDHKAAEGLVARGVDEGVLDGRRAHRVELARPAVGVAQDGAARVVNGRGLDPADLHAILADGRQASHTFNWAATDNRGCVVQCIDCGWGECSQKTK